MRRSSPILRQKSFPLPTNFSAIRGRATRKHRGDDRIKLACARRFALKQRHRDADDRRPVRGVINRRTTELSQYTRADHPRTSRQAVIQGRVLIQTLARASREGSF
jgi:hypothetical protein